MLKYRKASFSEKCPNYFLSLIVARISWFLGRWNHIQTNTPFVIHRGGTPTLKVVKRFRKGSVCKAYWRSTYERTFWVKLSRIMLYQRSYQPGLSTLQLDKKHLQKCHLIGPSRIPARTHNVWATRAERLENLFLLCANVSVWVQRSKMLWETSLSTIKLKFRIKRYSFVLFL